MISAERLTAEARYPYALGYKDAVSGSPTVEKLAPQTRESIPPASWEEAVKSGKFEAVDWERVEAAMSVLSGEKIAVTPKPPEPEPTDSQKFWREMYRTGKLSPYQKDRPKMSWKSAKDAWNNPQSQGVDSKIMAVDLALRGGADKDYNQLGDMSKRATRMAVMAGNMVPFTAFDILTSIPGNLFLAGVDKYKELHAANKTLENAQERAVRLATISGALDGPRRLFEILNDKMTTALGDKLVQTLTGEKGGWIHESSDKTGDFLDGAVGMYYEDAVNGPVVESTMRFMYEFPVFGALVEQGWTKLSALQEQSPFSKAWGKAIFGGLGTMIGTFNKLREADKKVALKDNYIEPKSPSRRMSEATMNFLVKLFTSNKKTEEVAAS